MTTDVQLYRNGAWESIDYSEFKIVNGVSDVKVAPTAEFRTHVDEDVVGGQDVRVQIDGTTRFEGTTKSAGAIDQRGMRRVEAQHDAYILFEETVSISAAGPDADAILQAALDASNSGGDYTLDYVGTVETLNEDYSVSRRTLKDIFRDICDRTNRIWWVDGSTIHVDTLGGRGTWQSVSIPGDPATVQQFDEGDVDNVRNDVAIVGTLDERVVGVASDSTSISDYGRRAETFNVKYISTQTEADQYAQELLRPDPITYSRSRLSICGGTIKENL